MKLTTELRRKFRDYRDRTKYLRENNLASDPNSVAGLDSIFEQALDESAEAKAAAEQADKETEALIDEARSGNREAKQELCELRMEQVDLYVRATSNFATLMYETTTLKDNEQFVVEHSYRNQVRVKYLSQDGGARTVKAVKARKQVFVDVRELHSDEVGYQMRDIQQGNDVAAAAQATVDTGWDMSNKVDTEAFNMLQGGSINGVGYGAGVYGAFKTTGAALDKTFITHPRIQTANLPVRNHYNNVDLDDNGTSSASNAFRLAVIRKIMEHCAAFGNIFGTPIAPTGAILIPSSEATQLSQEIKPTGLFNNKVAEGILNQYLRFSYMDVNWTLIPDVTLPKGTCYPVLNRPIGRILTKPSMDQEWVESFPKKNWEIRSAMKVLTMTIMEPWRVNALRISYSSAPTTLSTNE